jgi:hypothetical protein
VEVREDRNLCRASVGTGMMPASGGRRAMDLTGGHELSCEGQMGQITPWAGVSMYLKGVHKMFP